MILLSEIEEKSREELIDIILDLDKKRQELEEKLKESKQKEKESKKYIKVNVRPKRRKRPGRKAGHEGLTRPRPDQIDEIIEQELSECPHCDHALNESVEVIEHIQEDIIPARIKVTKFKKHRYWCPCCQDMVTAPYHETEVPNGYLGPNVLVQAVILKYHHCLPYNKISQLIEQLTGLKVSAGALAQSLQRISQWLKVEHKVILEAIRGSPTVHIDETGWRLDGKGHWLWAFINKKLAYYHIDRSRGRTVVKNTLPDSYDGIIVSDFYGVYWKLPYKRQKCLVHLLRELHTCSKRDDSKEYQRAYKKIKRVINDAVKLSQLKEKLVERVYERKCKRIKVRLFHVMCGNYRNKNLVRISKRFSKYWLDMLTFLKEDVDWNNNLAERMIRPNVIYRNRSFGNRSDKGAEAHSVLMSIIQSLILQDQKIFESLKAAYLAHRQGQSLPLLCKCLAGPQQ